MAKEDSSRSGADMEPFGKGSIFHLSREGSLSQGLSLRYLFLEEGGAEEGGAEGGGAEVMWG